MDRIERIARESERRARLLVKYEQRFRRHCIHLADQIVATILARYPDAVKRELSFDTYTRGIGDIAWSYWVSSVTLPDSDKPSNILLTLKREQSGGWMDPLRLVAFRLFTEPFTVGPSTGSTFKVYYSADVDECWHMAQYLGQNVGDVLTKPREMKQTPSEV